MTNYLQNIDVAAAGFCDHYDELPLWSARFAPIMLEKLPLRRESKILDAGAGTGFLAIELAQRCGPDSVVYAVDPWKEAMARLQRKLSALGVRNVVPLALDLADVDLPDESIDLIVSNLGINNFADPESALTKCRRLLKPDGQIFLTTNLVGHMAEFYDAFRETLVATRLQSQLEMLDAHIHHRATVESVRGLFDKCGFDLVDVIEQTFHERYADGTAMLNHYFIRLGFMPGWKEILPVGSENVFFTALEERLNHAAGRNGGLTLTIPAACILGAVSE